MKLATDTTDSLTTAVLRWDPTLDTQLEGRRRPGRPKTRWTDDIRSYIRQVHDAMTTTTTTNQHNQVNTIPGDAEGHGRTVHDNSLWIELARDSSTWAALEDGYVTMSSANS